MTHEVLDLINTVESRGGRLWLQGGHIKYSVPKAASIEIRPMLDELRARHKELAAILRERTPPQGVPAPPRCPPLPQGVRLIAYAPKEPPVAVSVCSLVTNVDRFIRHQLEELDARLHSPVQIRAGDSVFEILRKLEEVGLEVTLEWP